MTKFGYPKRRSLGVVAAGGTLGILIPPSGPMILYSLVTDASIGALFLAGLIPGLLMAAIFSAYCMLDIDLIWYGVLLMINLELAMITPPVGMNLFVIKGITDEPLSEVIKGAYPYVLMMCLGLALLVAFPWLATALPHGAGYGL